MHFIVMSTSRTFNLHLHCRPAPVPPLADLHNPHPPDPVVLNHCLPRYILSRLQSRTLSDRQLLRLAPLVCPAAHLLYVTFNPHVVLGSPFVSVLGECSIPDRFILFCLGRHGQPGHDERVSCGNGIFRICIWSCVVFVGLHY